MKDKISLESDGPDPLGVLASTRPLMEGAQHAGLSAEGIARFVKNHQDVPLPETAEEKLHCTFLAGEQFVIYLLVLEALNFCFWDEEPRWRVTWQGQTFDGYWALAAALQRAVVADALPLWDPDFLAGLDQAATAGMLKGSGNPIPLLKERSENLRELGVVLREKFQGSGLALLEEGGGDGPSVAKILAENFSSFNDTAQWQGQTLRFYKRAQIFSADYARLAPFTPESSSLPVLRRTEHLTAFADYKVPQVMEAQGLIVYSDSLKETLRTKTPIPPGSTEELEIRAATLWGCELASQAFAATGRKVSPADVDYILWVAGQANKPPLPYHRTRTIYY